MLGTQDFFKGATDFRNQQTHPLRFLIREFRGIGDMPFKFQNEMAEMGGRPIGRMGKVSQEQKVVGEDKSPRQAALVLMLFTNRAFRHFNPILFKWDHSGQSRRYQACF
jgi:hypothetical protein